MKNKKFIILFLVLLLLLLPFEKTYGQSLWEETKATIGAILSNLFSLDILAGCGTSLVLCVIVLIAYLLIIVFHLLLYFINNYVLANLVNFASVLDPFAGTHGQSPALIAWQVLQSFGFIILVFSALGAAYEWLLGDDATAKRMIFNIILVALLISFTYTLIQAAFYGVRNFEDGITNGQSRYIGTIMSVSLWQRNPFGIVGDLTANISVSGSRLGAALLGLISGVGAGAVVGFLAPSAAFTGIAKLLVQTISYIFIILFDMGMFIILVVTLTLFIVRYLYIIALTALSPIAVATSVLPEFQKAPFLKTIFSKLHVAGDWLELLVKWLLIVPIFVILVLLCNITKENILANINLANLNDFVQYVMLYVGFTACYAGSIYAAVNLGGGAAAWAKGIATTALLTAGGAAAGAFMYYTKGKAGQFMTRMGKAIEEKVGTGGPLGLRSLISQRFGKAIREKGEEWIKARYGVDAEAAKARVEAINQQLQRTTDPAQIANLTGQLTKLVQQYRNNDYVLNQIREAIRGMSPISAGKLLSDSGFLKEMAGSKASYEDIESIIELINKAKERDVRNLANDISFLNNLQGLAPQVIEAFGERVGQVFRERDVIDFMSDPNRINAIQAVNLAPLRDSLNKASRGFLEAVIHQNVNEAANALSLLSRDFWQEPGSIRKIYDILGAQTRLLNKREDILLSALQQSSERKEILRAALREPPNDPTNGPVRYMLQRLFQQPSPIQVRGGPPPTPAQQQAQQLLAALSQEEQGLVQAL